MSNTEDIEQIDTFESPPKKIELSHDAKSAKTFEVSYDYVLKCLDINRHLPNVEHEVTCLLSKMHMFFSKSNTDVFKTIVPDLLPCSDIDKITDLMKLERRTASGFDGYQNFTYNHAIIRYLIEEVYASVEDIGNKFNDIIASVGLKYDDLIYYVDRGLVLNHDNYITIAYSNLSKSRRSQICPNIDLENERLLQVFCFKQAYRLCNNDKDDIQSVICCMCDYFAQHDKMQEFVNLIEEADVQISDQMESLVHVFATNYHALSGLDFFLENYVTDYNNFLEIIFNDEDIGYEMTACNLIQILARISKYVDLNETLALKKMQIN
jgi:hypothetical protein